MNQKKASLIAQMPLINNHGFDVNKYTVPKSFPLHWHDCWEIEIVLDGVGTQTLNGVQYPLSRGSVYILNPTDFHSIDTKNLSIYHIMFSDEIMSDEMAAAFSKYDSGFCAQISDIELEQLSDICSLLMYENSKGLPMMQNATKNLIQYLFVRLLRLFSVDIQKTALTKKTPVSKAVMYINMHFRENPTLTDTAAYAGISANYLSEQFRTAMGETYKQYLTSLKLNYAKKLLLSSDISVTEICFACGFGSMSNFLKIFREHFGISPTKMRFLN